MKVVESFNDLKDLTSPVVLVTGFFDGVHLGHQALLEAARTNADARGADPWVLTFDPHPSKVLRPETAKPLMTSTSQKLSLLASHGMTGTVMMPFTRELAAQEPEDFFAGLHSALPGLAEVVIGSNWTFGRGARGNADLLKTLTADTSVEITVIEPVLQGGAPVSSTRIRDAVFAGRLADAEAMLGRPYSIVGKVIPGRKYGTVIGFPTANVQPDCEVYPPFGIYAARLKVGNDTFGGAGYIGHHSLVPAGSRAPIVEIHLLDADVDLYDAEVEILFLKFMRDDRRFSSEQELVDQIAEDVRGVREHLDALK